MLVTKCVSTNLKGHLTIEGADAIELAERFGTPLYVYSESKIRQKIREFILSVNKYYNGNGMVVYASKAFSCKEMYRICMQENIGIDVVSGGELYTALSVGFPAEKIVFHGNNKTRQELVQAVENGVGRIIVDNLTELKLLDSIAKELGKVAGIMLRIKPGVDAHTHDFIKTGQIDSKFGFALETGEAMKAVKTAIAMDNVNLRGLHCHIGSQIFDVDPFELAAKVMLEFYRDIKLETGKEFDELNLGGGFGIKYLKSDSHQPYGEYMKNVAAVVNTFSHELGIKTPFILIEPGRSIVGVAGVTLYTVGNVKDIPDVRTYVSVDGGMTDNPRYALYKSDYEIVCADRAEEDRSETVTVAGKCCESGDLIQENTKIQPVKAGDTLAVLSTGAYNYSMASNYNRIPRPAVVMVKDGEARVVVKRETYEQITANDL
ncbi:MAG: diaminopimelate decarboxylase [Clostridia bacterium]|nr:diaminopimelate decarboxylase [Clostridia bacterium]